MSGRPITVQDAIQATADAGRFLTRLPVPVAPLKEGTIHPLTMAAFPVVGLFLGALLWTLCGLLSLFLPPSVADLLTLAVLAALTGAIHWDGLMDTADALGAPVERRSEVLKDVHVGSYGMVALLVVAGSQWGALSNLSGWMHGAALLLFPVWGRWMMLLVTLGMDDLRAGEGLAGRFLGILNERQVQATGLFVAVLSMLLLGLFNTLVLLIAVLLLAWLLRRLFRNGFGGVSGDLIGASCVAAEAVVLVLLSGLA